jgi:hypothetical protein
MALLPLAKIGRSRELLGNGDLILIEEENES